MYMYMRMCVYVCIYLYVSAYVYICVSVYTCVAFEVFYMYLVYTQDGIVLVSRYCATCLNLLFSNRRVEIYI